MVQVINNKIQQGFSEAAKKYDLLSGLHREVADRLWAQVIKEPKPDRLLDVGCGTGYLTGKVKEHFTGSKVIGIDFAQGMIEAARSKNKDIEWIEADCHKLPFPDGIFDMVMSNLAYQWAGDLSQAFEEARRVLVPKGVFTCTLFGYKTCQELFQSLDEAKSGPLQFARLPKEDQIKEVLTLSGFQNSNIDSQCIKINFKDMQALMSWLKSIGANNLSREGYLGREAISKAASIYRERFGDAHGITATFEVIWVYVKK